MTRKNILNSLKLVINASDVVFCVGESLCKECSLYTKGTMFIPYDIIDVFSMALGTAMATDKRVIVITEDYYLLNHFNSLLQAAVSECKNLFFIILVSKVFTPFVKQQTITNSLRSLKGILFNTGMLVHEYDVYFKNKESLLVLNNIINSSIGPAIGTVSVDNNRLYSKKVKHISVDAMTSMISFIRDTTIETSVSKGSNKLFDLDAIMKDG